MSTPLTDAIDRALEMATPDRVSVIANAELIAGLPPEHVEVTGIATRYRGVLLRGSPSRIRDQGFMVQVRVA
ncbi:MULTISPECIES: hypothetical protein [unclassified Sphingomonas]|uniref:hypothetical protein n=1 Tax=unclassified Sphingomonas TaxID=196159 RepID=UPI0008350FDF|nr:MULTISPECIES: hypothetical protein [unclassified Sphingomonas]